MISKYPKIELMVMILLALFVVAASEVCGQGWPTDRTQIGPGADPQFLNWMADCHFQVYVDKLPVQEIVDGQPTVVEYFQIRASLGLTAFNGLGKTLDAATGHVVRELILWKAIGTQHNHSGFLIYEPGVQQISEARAPRTERRRRE